LYRAWHIRELSVIFSSLLNKRNKYNINYDDKSHDFNSTLRVDKWLNLKAEKTSLVFSNLRTLALSAFFRRIPAAAAMN